MSNIVYEMATYLQSKGIGTVGVNIFVGEAPKDIESAIILIAVPGQQMDVDTGIEYQSFDVWSRDKDVANGYNVLQSVFYALDRVNSIELTSYHIYLSTSTSAIADLDKDVEGRKLWKLPIVLIYRNKNLVS